MAKPPDLPSLAVRRRHALRSTVINHNPSRADVVDGIDRALASLGQPDTEVVSDSDRWRRLVGLLAGRDAHVSEPEEVFDMIKGLTHTLMALAEQRSEEAP